MAFIFGHRKKGPLELVKSTKKHLDILSDSKQSDEKILKKSLEKVSLNLSSMKFMLYGDAENEPREIDYNKLIEELFHSNLLYALLVHMADLEFEARKDVAQIYNFILRQRKSQIVDYVKNSHIDILQLLVEGYNDSEVALNCGSILREVIRHEELNEILLYGYTSPASAAAAPTAAATNTTTTTNDNNTTTTSSSTNSTSSTSSSSSNPSSNHINYLIHFFEYVQLSTFDIASDAFATFKLMLTKHKVLCAKFLETHFDSFMQNYNVLLQSRNYVTKRQSLKLLGELLLNRSNFNVMMKYINSPENLKIMMNLLRGNTKAIQFEAFHVFKIFVANPKKSPPVVEILSRNKRRLIEFLQKFQKDKAEDDQFNEEKNTLLNTLNELEDLSGDVTDRLESTHMDGTTSPSNQSSSSSSTTTTTTTNTASTQQSSI